MMDETLMTELHHKLDALHASLSSALSGAEDRAGTVELDQSAVGRVSRVDAIQSQAMAKAEERRTKQRLATVVNALARIGTDRYGICLRCGDDIELERLRARPETPFCLDCAG